MTTTLIEEKELVKEISENIKKDIDKNMEELNICGVPGIMDLLGNLISPFTGINCPALYSGFEDSCDKVLEALIVFFVKEENLKHLPEGIQSNTLNALAAFHTFLQRMKKHDNTIFFDVVNLYNIKRHNKKPVDIEEYKNWYGADTY